MQVNLTVKCESNEDTVVAECSFNEISKLEKNATYYSDNEEEADQFLANVISVYSHKLIKAGEKVRVYSNKDKSALQIRNLVNIHPQVLSQLVSSVERVFKPRGLEVSVWAYQ